MSVLEKTTQSQTPVYRRQLSDFFDQSTNTLHPDARQHIFTSSRGRITSHGAENYVPSHTNGQSLHVYPVDLNGTKSENTVSLILWQQLTDKKYGY